MVPRELSFQWEISPRVTLETICLYPVKTGPQWEGRVKEQLPKAKESWRWQLKRKEMKEKGSHELNLSHGQSLFVCAMIWEFSNASIL